MEHNFKWKNDGRTKVMIGCGTRPEIIRLAAVIKRCREYFDCCVVYYNQNWDRNLSTVFWEDFELKNTFGEYGPDILVPVVGENLVTFWVAAMSFWPSCSRRAIWCWAIPTPACPPSAQSGCISPCFTWRRVTAARMSACPRRPTAASWT